MKTKVVVEMKKNLESENGKKSKTQAVEEYA